MRTACQESRYGFSRRLRKADGNAEVGAAKAADDRESYANHLAVAIYKRSTGAAGSSLCIVNNFIRQDVADVSLRHQGTDQLALLKLIHNFLRVAAA